MSKIYYLNKEAVLCRSSSGVEHFHGKEGVMGSIPIFGSI